MYYVKLTCLLQVLSYSEAEKQVRPEPKACHRAFEDLAVDAASRGRQLVAPRLHRRARRLARLPRSSRLVRGRPPRLVHLLHQRPGELRSGERQR